MIRIKNIDPLITGYSYFMVLLVFPFFDSRIKFERILFLVLKIAVFFVVSVALLDLFRIVDLRDNLILNWLSATDNAFISKQSSTSVFYYLIFLKTSPLFFLLLFFSLNRREYFTAIIAFLAIFLSGTRANVYILLASVMIYFIFVEKKSKLKNGFLFCCLLGGVILSPQLIQFVVDSFIKKGSSDLVRSGHITSIIELMKNPFNFIFGTGLGSYFFTLGRNEFVNVIELSYWDLYRQIGLFSLFFFFFVSFPVYRLWKTPFRWLCIAQGSFLIIAYTNPFLFSTTGFLLIVYAYVKMNESGFLLKYKPINECDDFVNRQNLALLNL